MNSDEDWKMDVSTDEKENTSLNHKETLHITRQRLQEILGDPLLSDIPKYATSEEIRAKLDLEQGKAFVVFLKRETEEGEQNIDLIANDKTTVTELKQHIQRKLARLIKEEDGPTCLSWKHFWKTYWLVHNHEKLADDRKALKDYNIKDKSEIVFLKRLRRE